MLLESLCFSCYIKKIEIFGDRRQASLHLLSSQPVLEKKNTFLFVISLGQRTWACVLSIGRVS